MDFILRILFSGLIAFVPSDDGKEVTVLLLNTQHAGHTSDGSALPHHNPLLVARAGNCTGDCPKRDADVAQIMFMDKSLAAAQDALEEAVGGGGAWKLAGSDLSIVKGSPTAADLPPLVVRNNVRGTSNGQLHVIPTTSTEREDFSWIADGQQLCNGCTINPAVLSAQPPAGLIAARLRLRSGKVFTYSVARLGSDVTPVNFNRLDGTGSTSSYTQAIASWVGADIEIDGSDVEIVEATFGGGTGRSMKLSPDSTGKVEIAVLNNPGHIPPVSSNNDAPQVGKHFEAYYDLYQTPPARDTRLVPRAGAAPGAATYPQIGWQQVHPSTVLWSDLLNKLRLDVGRTMYDRMICPPIKP